MTATTTQVQNPYLDEWLAAGGTMNFRDYWSVSSDQDYKRELDLLHRRSDLVAKYAWAIPTPEAIAALVALGPLVEIGAGTGYWAWQIAQAGGTVVAFDKHPPDPRAPRHHYGHKRQWYPVKSGGPSMARRYPGRALLLCWPPYSDSMASRTLARYRGTTLAYIGEGEGGCTADDAFFAALDAEWDEAASVAVPQWIGIRDRLTIYTRRRMRREEGLTP